MSKTEIMGESEPQTMERLREIAHERDMRTYETYRSRLCQIRGVKVKKPRAEDFRFKMGSGLEVRVQVNRTLTTQDILDAAAESNFFPPSFGTGTLKYRLHERAGGNDLDDISSVSAQPGVKPTIYIRTCRVHEDCEEKAARFINALLAKGRNPTKWETVKSWFGRG